MENKNMRPEYVMYGCMAGYIVMLLCAFGVYMRENRLTLELESAEKEKQSHRKAELVEALQRHVNRGKQYE
jgi:hypothetical protein